LQPAELWEQQTALAEQRSPHPGLASQQAAHEHTKAQQSKHCYNCSMLNKGSQEEMLPVQLAAQLA